MTDEASLGCRVDRIIHASKIFHVKEDCVTSGQPQRNGFRIEWEVTPSINMEGEEKTYEEEGIGFLFDGKTLSAEIMDTGLNW